MCVLGTENGSPIRLVTSESTFEQDLRTSHSYWQSADLGVLEGPRSQEGRGQEESPRGNSPSSSVLPASCPQRDRGDLPSSFPIPSSLLPSSPLPSTPFPFFPALPPFSPPPLASHSCSFPHLFPPSDSLFCAYTYLHLLFLCPSSRFRPAVSRRWPSCSLILSSPVSPAADAQLFIMIERQSVWQVG